MAEQKQERSLLAVLAAAKWTPLAQSGAFLLRCLENAQVVDMQDDRAARSLPPLELIKLQTQLARMSPILPLP